MPALVRPVFRQRCAPSPFKSDDVPSPNAQAKKDSKQANKRETSLQGGTNEQHAYSGLDDRKRINRAQRSYIITGTSCACRHMQKQTSRICKHRVPLSSENSKTSATTEGRGLGCPLEATFVFGRKDSELQAQQQCMQSARSIAASGARFMLVHGIAHAKREQD